MLGINLQDITFEQVKIGSICEVWTRGSTYYKSSELVGPQEGAIVLGPSNIVDDQIDYSEVLYYSWEGYYRKPNLNLEDGDILLAKYAAAGSPYKSAVIEHLPCPAISNPNVIMLKKIKCNGHYLQLLLSSEEFQAQLKASQTNSTLPSLSATNLQEMMILLPPIEVQIQLEKHISKLRTAKKELVSLLSKEIEAREKEYAYYADAILWNKLN